MLKNQDPHDVPKESKTIHVLILTVNEITIKGKTIIIDLTNDIRSALKGIN